MNILLIGVGVAALVVVVLAALSVRIVRPTHRGLVERLGKYNHYCEPGIHGVIPFVERLYRIDVREVLVEAQPQEIITNDNLNARSTRRSTSRSRPTRRTSRPRSTTSPTTRTRSSTWRAPRCATSSAR